MVSTPPPQTVTPRIFPFRTAPHAASLRNNPRGINLQVPSKSRTHMDNNTLSNHLSCRPVPAR